MKIVVRASRDLEEIEIIAVEGSDYIHLYCSDDGGTEETSFAEHNDHGVQGRLREATRVFKQKFYSEEGIILDYTPEIVKSS